MSDTPSGGGTKIATAVFAVAISAPAFRPLREAAEAESVSGVTAILWKPQCGDGEEYKKGRG